MYANWNILEPVYRTINISISNDGTIQIEDVKENHDPLIFKYHSDYCTDIVKELLTKCQIII